jgi:hypothetical protein
MAAKALATAAAKEPAAAPEEEDRKDPAVAVEPLTPPHMIFKAEEEELEEAKPIDDDYDLDDAEAETTLKPYMCAECGAAFRAQSSFRRHMRVHTGAHVRL